MSDENLKFDAKNPGEPLTPDAGAPLTADELRSVAQEIAASYPPPRLGTELVLLEINPHRAHAYWNVDVEDFQTAAAACGDPSPPILLRLHDVTGIEFDGTNAHSYFDMQVQGLQGHWYVDLWKDGRTHIAELGLRRADGRLEILARSNPVSTPPASESSHYHTEAVDLAQSDPTLRLTDLSADPHLSPENTDTETGEEIHLNAPPLHVVPPPDPAAFAAPDSAFDASEHSPAAFIPSSEPEREVVSQPESDRAFPLPIGADARPATYPPVGPSLREADYPAPATVSEKGRVSAASQESAGEVLSVPPADIGQAFETSSDRPQPVSSPEASPIARPHSPAANEDRVAAQARDEQRPDWPSAEELSRFVHDSPSHADVPHIPASDAIPPAPEPAPTSGSETGGSQESIGDSHRHAAHEETPAPREASPPGPPASLPLENYVTLFSADHGRPQVALEVNVELHIFGRAKPGTQLSFYGQPVQLRPDGSFSLRKPFPHGAVVLPLLAIDPTQP